MTTIGPTFPLPDVQYEADVAARGTRSRIAAVVIADYVADSGGDDVFYPASMAFTRAPCPGGRSRAVWIESFRGKPTRAKSLPYIFTLAPLRRALASVELIRLQLKVGNYQEASVLARQMRKSAFSLPENDVVSAVICKLIQLEQVGELSLDAVNDLLREAKQGLPRLPRRPSDADLR